jgi:hypothetical protein
LVHGGDFDGKEVMMSGVWLEREEGDIPLFRVFDEGGLLYAVFYRGHRTLS